MTTNSANLSTSPDFWKIAHPVFSENENCTHLKRVTALPAAHTPCSRYNTHRRVQSSPEELMRHTSDFKAQFFSALPSGKGVAQKRFTLLLAPPLIDTRGESDDESVFSSTESLPVNSENQSRVSLMSGPSFVNVSPWQSSSTLDLLDAESLDRDLSTDKIKAIPDLKTEPTKGYLESISEIATSFLRTLKSIVQDRFPEFSLFSQVSEKAVDTPSLQTQQNHEMQTTRPRTPQFFLASIKPLDLSDFYNF
ncbi:MAG: hypothetical protein VX185_08980 [Pseudomonadota bacterium]|nr:hypothetical protein [Pseudomonadota bacterium]HBF06781.1 hypothetical protein [Gammaproteobacteria bacterium]|tara:strand:+ start:189 stop:941 length:753 start_codon:yes stop_codon:yes gene_type:complete